MAAGNFLSALIQRGVQAGAGALQGKKEGRDRRAAEARQAEEDALQRAVIEARMATEQRQQAALDREAADFVPRAQRIAEEEARIQGERAHQLALERLRGQNARATAGVRGTRTGGRSDPRVGVLNSRIQRLRGDRASDLAMASKPLAPWQRQRATPEQLQLIESAPSRAEARADSIATFERERDEIVGMGDDTGSEEILGTKTPQQWVDEVAAEHPDWDDNRIIAEAQRRAGGP